MLADSSMLELSSSVPSSVWDTIRSPVCQYKISSDILAMSFCKNLYRRFSWSGAIRPFKSTTNSWSMCFIKEGYTLPKSIGLRAKTSMSFTPKTALIIWCAYSFKGIKSALECNAFTSSTTLWLSISFGSMTSSVCDNSNKLSSWCNVSGASLSASLDSFWTSFFMPSKISFLFSLDACDS